MSDLPKNSTPIGRYLVDREQERIRRAFEETMIYGCPRIENYKLDDIATCQQPWPKSPPLTAAEIANQMDEIDEIMEGMRPGMHRKHYNAFAEACQAIEQGIVDLHIPMPEHYRDQVMELVVARVALVCAKDNKNFDSFQFAEAARKNARHGMNEKTGRAPRTTVRVTKGSQP
jgi:hypothetical protein